MPRQASPVTNWCWAKLLSRVFAPLLIQNKSGFRGVREEDIDLTWLSSAAPTRLLQADYHDLRMPRRTRKHIRAYLQLSHIAQDGVLAQDGVYVYQQEPEDPHWVQQDEDDCNLHSEPDWGTSDSPASVSTIDDLPYTPAAKDGEDAWETGTSQTPGARLQGSRSRGAWPTIVGCGLQHAAGEACLAAKAW